MITTASATQALAENPSQDAVPSFAKAVLGGMGTEKPSVRYSAMPRMMDSVARVTMNGGIP